MTPADTCPIISVGILSYERPELLRHTLDSVAQQTYPHLEILISDNCSRNPEVRKVVEEFVKKRPEAKVFYHEKNRGAFWNFQFILLQATSPLFIWLADDDFWSPDFLASLVSARGTSSPSLTYSKAVPISLEDEKCGAPTKERLSGKRGVWNVIRQVTFDLDSIIYGLFDTRIGQKYAHLLQAWPVTERWGKRLPTVQVDFVSYVFLYGLLLECDFINASKLGGVHYMILRHSTVSSRANLRSMKGIGEVFFLVGSMAYINSLLGFRFVRAAVVAKNPAAMILGPVAACYYFFRRLRMAVVPRLVKG